MKCGRRLCFHGAFSSKSKAVQKEKHVQHGFIRTTRIKGKKRFLVLTSKRRKH